jgi:WD40 repeat protein
VHAPNKDGFLASPKRTFLILLPVVIVGAATAAWLAWFNEPPRILPPEFVRSMSCKDAKLVRLLVTDKDHVISGDSMGRIFEGPFAAETANALDPIGDSATTFLANSDDGLLLVGDDSGLLRSWQQPGLKFKSVNSPKIPVTCAVFRSLVGRQEILLGLSDGRLLVIDEDGPDIHKTDHLGIKAMALSPDQKTLATSGTSGLIIFFDASTLTPIKSVRHHKTEIPSIAWSADGESLASGDWNGRIALVSTKTHKVIATGEQPDAVSKLVWLSDQLITASWDGKIRRWSVDKRKISMTGEFDTGGVVFDLAINNAADNIVTVSGGSQIEFWKLPE